MGTIDSSIFGLLQNAVNAASLRQSVYANNIANVDTPGYKRQDVSFENLLQSQLQTAPAGQLGVSQMTIPTPSTGVNLSALSQVTPQVVQDNSTAVSNNGNNVDIDNEMTLLAQNQIRYNTLIEDMKMRFDRLNQAIIGG